MKRVRGGSGLGDAIYVRVVADYLISQGHPVEACTNYPDVFIGSGAVVSPFRRDRIDVLAHYSARKYKTNTTQWQDICGTAGIEEIPLSLAWSVKNRALVDTLMTKAAGRQIILVHGGRAPMGRTDGFGAELLPERAAFELALGELRDCYLVRIGNGAEIYSLPADNDLTNETSISDLLDIATVCAGVVAQCSFAVPLAEIFDKKLLTIWAARGLNAAHPYVKAITPGKILSKPSWFVIDDWPDGKIQEVARAFRGI